VTAFLLLLFAYILSQFYRAFLAIVAADLNRDLGLSAADLGSLSAIWFAAFAFAQFPVGWALDRIGPRRTCAGLLIVAVVGAVLLAVAQSFAACLVAMALIGIGCSAALMGSLYLFARTYPVERFAMLGSLLIGLGAAGNLAAGTPLALASEAFGWRAAMLAVAALTAVSALLLALLLRDPPRIEPSGEGSALAGLAAIASLRALWLLLPLTFVSYAVVIATRSLWIAPFLGEVHGFDALERGNAALAMAAAMSLGALAYGPIERWLRDPKLTTLIGSALTGAAYVALGLLGHRDPGLAVALLAAIGAFGLSYGILMAHGRLFFPAGLIGRGVTFLNFAFIGGAGVVQWLSGRFVQGAQDAGVDPATTFGLLHLGFGAALLLATAIYLFAPARPASAQPQRASADPTAPRRA
jgi:predicted MFS family arabinose efflux permease